jgi:hypothetical protein
VIVTHACRKLTLRHDLVREEERRTPATQRFERAQPNELWQMDFKERRPEEGHRSSKAAPEGGLRLKYNTGSLLLRRINMARLVEKRTPWRTRFQRGGFRVRSAI